MRFKKIYVEITNVCNLNCSFCKKHVREDRFMSLDEFSLVLDRIEPFTSYIYLHVKGEPLLHPLVDEMVVMAKMRGFFVNLTTNGTFLSEKKHLFKHIRQINLSLHDTYDMDIVRVLRKSAEAVFSVRIWGDRTEEKNAAVICALEEEFGVRIGEERRQKLGEGMYLSIEDRFEWDNFNDINDTNNAGKCGGDGVCGYCLGLTDQLAVLCDGTVVPCCIDHNGVVGLGNLFETELSAILETGRARRMIEGFRRRLVVEPLCIRCDFRKRF